MAAEMSPADAVGALVPAITLLGFGAAAALVSRALNLSPIVGYLLAGILIGPGMLDLIHESGGTHLLAELGVVFQWIGSRGRGCGKIRRVRAERGRCHCANDGRSARFSGSGGAVRRAFSSGSFCANTRRSFRTGKWP